MSAAPVARFGSAGEIDAWVAEHFPAQNRQWKDNLKTYLREIAKEQRANCKAGDGPSLQACCAHLALNPFSFQTFVNSTNRLKKKEWAEHILDRLLAYRSSKVPLADTLSAPSGSPPAPDTSMADTIAAAAAVTSTTTVSQTREMPEGGVPFAKRVCLDAEGSQQLATEPMPSVELMSTPGCE